MLGVRMQEVEFNKINNLIQEVTENLMKPIEKESEKLLKKVDKTLEGIQEISEKLLDDVKKHEKPDEKVLDTSLKSAERLSEIYLEKVHELTIPSDISFTSLIELDNNLEDLIKTMLSSGRKYIPRISKSRRLYKAEIVTIDYYLKDLNKTRKELESFLKEKKELRDIDEIQGDINEIESMVRKNDELEERKEKILQILKELKSEKASHVEELSDLKSEDLIIQIDEIDKEIDSIKSNYIRLLRPLEKPLIKFQKLVHDGEYSLGKEEIEFLKMYIDEPFEGFTKERKDYPSLKRILNAVKELVEAGHLKLKKRMEKKLVNASDAILKKDKISSLRTEYDQLLEKRIEASNQIKEEGLKTQQKSITREIKNLDKKIKELNNEGKEISKEIRVVRDKIDDLKKKIEKSLSGLIGEDIEITGLLEEKRGPE